MSEEWKSAESKRLKYKDRVAVSEHKMLENANMQLKVALDELALSIASSEECRLIDLPVLFPCPLSDCD